jgi:hypothetical protein
MGGSIQKENVMTLISNVSLKELVDLNNNLVKRLEECTTLEDAAQEYMSILYETLSESIILARFFVAIPFGELPEPNKKFVSNLAQSADISDLIKEKTLILSLMGSRGKYPEWNDRRNSKGHIGIPLASSDFIDRIPMMSRLLKQLGVGIDWIDTDDTELVLKTFRNLNGVFFVRDASTETDNSGRMIITAQDFVQEENVKTVFGIGGCYLGTSLFFTTIIFVSEFLDKDKVERFMLQANKFKTATLRLVNTGKIFA